MPRCLIVGAGAIGLSLAWELARRGWQVRVLDRGEPGREASWAGAGIIPPYSRAHARHPLEQLKGLCCDLHREWARRLQSETGIDNGYHVCGGLYLARAAGEAASLSAWAATSREEGIQVERVVKSDLPRLEPALSASLVDQVRTAFLLPQEAQLRNPRHMQALVTAVTKAGVEMLPNTEMTRFVIQGETLEAVETTSGRQSADVYCVTAGAWSGLLLKQLHIEAGVLPIRGQMVLFRGQERILQRVVNEGSRYLVPRDDGRVLAGSTEEEAGFDKRTTEEALADITNFATTLMPALADLPIEKTWAGLRPASFDGLPYLGPLPGLANAYIASGHFRSGIYMSPGTAVVMAQIMAGETPEIDLAPFRVTR